VSLSIGSTDPLNLDYLRQLKRLQDRCQARFVTDHLCWTGVAGNNLHDLLPMPYTEEALAVVVEKVQKTQDFLGQRIALENPSSYLEFTDSTLSEWEFMAALAEQADCGILLDVNNIYVSSKNHGFDPLEYLAAIPPQHVVQYHVAGHTDKGTHILDTHIGPVIDPVWKLFGAAVERVGNRSTLLEWDEEIPAFQVVHREAKKARKFRNRVAAAVAS
jgi:uncharacterized protein (UPF0276 family)